MLETYTISNVSSNIAKDIVTGQAITPKMRQIKQKKAQISLQKRDRMVLLGPFGP